MSWTLNGLPVLSGTLQHPATGTWVARVTVGGDLETGPASLALPGLSLAGTTFAGGAFGGRTVARLVGGAGQLATVIPGQHFQQGATGRLIAESIVTAAGEQLDPDSTGVDAPLSAWCYFKGSASKALDQLAQVLGCSWWVTPAGLVRLRVLEWPADDPDGAQVLDRRDDLRRLVVALLDSPVLPGTTYQGQQVLAVDHELSATRWRASVRW